MRYDTSASRPGKVVAAALDLSAVLPDEQVQLRVEHALRRADGDDQVSAVEEPCRNILAK